MSRIHLSAPDVGDRERAMLLDAFDSNWIAPLGPHVDAFEAEAAAATGRRHAAALSSGTAAIDLALRLVGVERGDEVMASTFTFVGTVSPIVHLGATPVLVDSEEATWNIDVDLVEEELERRSRANRLPAALIAVDLYGQCADYERLAPICERHGVPLIEDAAEALGGSHRGAPAGSFGTVGILSFNGNKIVTTSGGGMLVTDVASYAERARFLATQAREPELHYEHREIGFNYRMSNLCAAVGRAQMASLEERVERRRKVFDTYADALGDLDGIDFTPESSKGRANRWLTTLTIDAARTGTTARHVCDALADQDIEARPTWKPMHLQPALRGAPTIGGAVSERLFSDGLCLPSGSGLHDAEVNRVIESVCTILAGG